MPGPTAEFAATWADLTKEVFRLLHDPAPQTTEAPDASSQRLPAPAGVRLVIASASLTDRQCALQEAVRCVEGISSATALDRVKSTLAIAHFFHAWLVSGAQPGIDASEIDPSLQRQA